MFEKIRKKFFPDTYLHWKENSRRPLHGSYSSDVISVGSKGYACDEERRSACNAYCCSNVILPWRLNPLEMACISNAVEEPPENFSEISDPLSRESYPAKLSTPFILKIKNNGYCAFSNMTETTECKEYHARPLVCRVFPMDVYGDELRQRKGCPGFKKGKKLDKHDIATLGTTIQMVKILEKTVFVPGNECLSYNHVMEGDAIVDYIGIDPSKVQNLTKGGFHTIVERTKRISDLEKQLRERNIDQGFFENFMLTSFERKYKPDNVIQLQTKN
jgi:Fe-S-cluster containining protein